MKLILLPYAGSLGLAYNQWTKSLREKYELYRIDYTKLKAGVREYECKSWMELCELLFEKIRDIITDDDYILFGHSMGTRAAYEIYDRLVENDMPLPKQIILSGCCVFTKPSEDPIGMPEEIFREKYIKLGGISDQVLACKELADYTFEDLRKDVHLLSQYQYKPLKITCPVMVLNGEQEEFSSKEEWEALLGCEVEQRFYPGKHFFIFDEENDILNDVFFSRF
ncbi:MAG: hypothetical protein IKL07_08635 [Clostridium sp.]|nr:hypothetical protein [Clostridium sp.]